MKKDYISAYVYRQWYSLYHLLVVSLLCAGDCTDERVVLVVAKLATLLDFLVVDEVTV
jgi:hypothetical protein